MIFICPLWCKEHTVPLGQHVNNQLLTERRVLGSVNIEVLEHLSLSPTCLSLKYTCLSLKATRLSLTYPFESQTYPFEFQTHLLME